MVRFRYDITKITFQYKLSVIEGLNYDCENCVTFE